MRTYGMWGDHRGGRKAMNMAADPVSLCRWPRHAERSRAELNTFYCEWQRLLQVATSSSARDK